MASEVKAVGDMTLVEILEHVKQLLKERDQLQEVKATLIVNSKHGQPLEKLSFSYDENKTTSRNVYDALLVQYEKIAEQDAEAAALRQQLAERDAQLMAADEAIGNVQCDNDSLRTQLEDLESQLDSKDDLLGVVRENENALRHRLAGYKGVADEVVKYLDLDHHKDIPRVVRSLREELTRIDETEDPEVEKLRTQLAARDRQVATMRDALTDCVREIGHFLSVKPSRRGGLYEAAYNKAKAALSSPAPTEGMNCDCGLPMNKNPHPNAGVLATLTEVGPVYECIPCTVKNRHGWAQRAMKAERHLTDARKAIRSFVLSSVQPHTGGNCCELCEWLAQNPEASPAPTVERELDLQDLISRLLLIDNSLRNALPYTPHPHARANINYAIDQVAAALADAEEGK